MMSAFISRIAPALRPQLLSAITKQPNLDVNTAKLNIWVSPNNHGLLNLKPIDYINSIISLDILSCLPSSARQGSDSKVHISFLYVPSICSAPSCCHYWLICIEYDHEETAKSLSFQEQLHAIHFSSSLGMATRRSLGMTYLCSSISNIASSFGRALGRPCLAVIISPQQLSLNISEYNGSVSSEGMPFYLPPAIRSPSPFAYFQNCHPPLLSTVFRRESF